MLGVFCPLLKIFLGNPYLEILDPSTLFVADAHSKKKITTNLVLLPLRSTFKYRSENRLCMTGLIPKCFNKLYKGSEKKVPPLMARPLRGGGALRKKEHFKTKTKT